MDIFNIIITKEGRFFLVPFCHYTYYRNAQTKGQEELFIIRYIQNMIL
jgi:hypothetical protein